MLQSTLLCKLHVEIPSALLFFILEFATFLYCYQQNIINYLQELTKNSWCFVREKQLTTAILTHHNGANLIMEIHDFVVAFPKISFNEEKISTFFFIAINGN